MTKFLLLLLLVFDMAYATELNVASIDWCPQLCPEVEKAGYITDTVEMIFKDSPFKLDIKTYPWSRSILLVNMGEKHALLSPAKAEAPDLIYPRNEVGVQRMCFFTRKESDWTYRGTDSLKGLRIGIASDTSIQELTKYVATNKQQFQYMPYNETYIEQSIEKLKLKRIDTFLFTYNTTRYQMKKAGVLADYKSAGCVSIAKVFMAFSPNPDLNIQSMVNYFDEQMDKLKTSGALKGIMTKYGLENWQKFTH